MAYFDHEKLEVYKKSLEFAGWSANLLRDLPKKYNITDQLDRASDSIVINIPEGNGKFTSKDRCKFFDISKASALECSGCLDTMVAKKIVSADQVQDGKVMLVEIVRMLIGLIKSNSNRVYEDQIDYNSTNDSDRD